jgi:8-oxo-dGTP diphosphatase
MHALLCERIAGDLILTEHQESRWLRKSELYTLDWAEADLPVLSYVEELLDG